jgi:SPP1 family predicted phage head-tail adaptor
MNAGRLDRRAMLRKSVQTRGPNGSVISTWQDVATFAVFKRPLSGREAVLAARDTAQIEDVFECRYRTDITSAMQLVVDGSTYDIVRPPEEIGRRDGLRIFGKVHVV